MDHDFSQKHGGNGNPCEFFGGQCGPCDGKGIMSYGDPPLEWSTCSKSDWEEAYSKKNWGDGCLEDISGEVSFHQNLGDYNSNLI